MVVYHKVKPFVNRITNASIAIVLLNTDIIVCNDSIVDKSGSSPNGVGRVF